MVKISNSESSDNWSSGDEAETENVLLPWHSSHCDQEFVSGPEKTLLLPWSASSTNPAQESSLGSDKASTSASPRSTLISTFVGMGFPKKIVRKAIEEAGESNPDLVLDFLLNPTPDQSFQASESVPCDILSSEGENGSDDFSDLDSYLENEEDVAPLSNIDKKLIQLTEVGFSGEEASSAIDTCGPNSSVPDLIDFIYAAQLAKMTDAPNQVPPRDALLQVSHQSISGESKMYSVDNHGCAPPGSRTKFTEAEERWRRKQERRRQQQVSMHKKRRVSANEDDTAFPISMVHMIGYGVPSDPNRTFQRKLPEEAIGPPFFYYENVACTPKGVWDTISRFLYEVEPEFVDSVHFSAAARKRGYVHNLPIHPRFPLLPIPPLTIQEALPSTKKWWPLWDTRRKLNCLSTCIASAQLTQKIRNALEKWNGNPPLETQKYVLNECRRWNLIWTGKNKAAPLEPEEMEMILGYPQHHTRGGGTSRTERYKALGNSFQVDTVAYHFSVLKNIFPNGINVLSLFSGIGGAEVTLHRLGIPLKNVVSAEISEVSRNVFRSWWEQTEQKGRLIEIEDIQDLTRDKLENLIHSVGGFDLIVGGSPCNNLAGNNRWTRSGLRGDHSILFYDFLRIVETVKSFMENNK